MSTATFAETTEDIISTREPNSVGPFTTVEAITSEEAAVVTTMNEPSTSIADSNSEATIDSESTTVVGFLTTVVETTKGAAGVTMIDERSTLVLDSGRTIGETNVADSERGVTVATTDDDSTSVVIAGYSGFDHTMSVEETSVAGADSTSVTMEVVASTYVDDTTTSVTDSERTATLEVTDSTALGVSSGEDYFTSVEATTGGTYADATAAIEIADTTEASYALGVEYTYVGGPTTSVTDSVDVVRGTVTDTTSVEETTIAGIQTNFSANFGLKF